MKEKIEKIRNLKTKNLEIISINGEYCKIKYFGKEYDNCKIEETTDDNFLFIGMPEHWWCGEYCRDYEEGPIINLKNIK